MLALIFPLLCLREVDDPSVPNSNVHPKNRVLTRTLLKMHLTQIWQAPGSRFRAGHLRLQEISYPNFVILARRKKFEPFIGKHGGIWISTRASFSVFSILSPIQCRKYLSNWMYRQKNIFLTPELVPESWWTWQSWIILRIDLKILSFPLSDPAKIAKRSLYGNQGPDSTYQNFETWNFARKVRSFES